MCSSDLLTAIHKKQGKRRLKWERITNHVFIIREYNWRSRWVIADLGTAYFSPSGECWENMPEHVTVTSSFLAIYPSVKSGLDGV